MIEVIAPTPLEVLRTKAINHASRLLKDRISGLRYPNYAVFDGFGELPEGITIFYNGESLNNGPLDTRISIRKKTHGKLVGVTFRVGSSDTQTFKTGERPELTEEEVRKLLSDFISVAETICDPLQPSGYYY